MLLTTLLLCTFSFGSLLLDSINLADLATFAIYVLPSLQRGR